MISNYEIREQIYRIKNEPKEEIYRSHGWDDLVILTNDKYGKPPYVYEFRITNNENVTPSDSEQYYVNLEGERYYSNYIITNEKMTALEVAAYFRYVPVEVNKKLKEPNLTQCIDIYREYKKYGIDRRNK